MLADPDRRPVEIVGGRSSTHPARLDGLESIAKDAAENHWFRTLGVERFVERKWSFFNVAVDRWRQGDRATNARSRDHSHRRKRFS